MNMPVEKSGLVDEHASSEPSRSWPVCLIARISCCAIVLLAASSSKLQAQSSLTVPGNTQITLAAWPNGRSSIAGHTSPANAPIKYSGTLAPGRGLQITVTGRVDSSGPEGLPASSAGWYTTPDEFLRPPTVVPHRSLIGVFLRTNTDQAWGLDFRGDLAEHSIVRPVVGQPFLIGNGRTPAGSLKTIVIPPQATSFYLAVAGEVTSTGSYAVTISDAAVPGPPSLPGPHRISAASLVDFSLAYPGPAMPGDWGLTMYSPEPINLPSGANRAYTFAVDGQVEGVGAEGLVARGVTAVTGAVIRRNAVVWKRSLVGIFRGATESRTVIPELNYTGDLSDLPLWRPELDQVFPIGTGRDSKGEIRTFVAPEGALRLFLAVASEPHLREFFSDPQPRGFFNVSIRPVAIPELPGNPIRISGSSSIQMATQPPGVFRHAVQGGPASFHAPTNSPSQVDIPLLPGQALRIVATGTVAGNGPNGKPTANPAVIRIDTGIPPIEVLPGALVGVFLGNSISPASPESLSHRDPSQLPAILEPKLQQTFAIGTGYLNNGTIRQIIVPAGATRLFLASAGTGKESGSFTVTVSPVSVTTPGIVTNGIVGAAGFQPGPLSPGSIGSVFGERFADKTSVASAVPLPSALEGTRAYFGLRPLPLYFVSPQQLNFQVPWELAGQTEQQLVVVRNGAASLPSAVKLQPSNPGIFVVTEQSGVIVNSRTGQLANLESPSKSGDTLVIYASGLGAVDGLLTTGAPASTTALQPARSLVECILQQNNFTAAMSVAFAGLAPGMIGVYQINAVIPDGVLPGPSQLQIRVGTSSSNSVSLALE
jgi:uncharacterized protein (TIGR03437 family)